MSTVEFCRCAPNRFEVDPIGYIDMLRLLRARRVFGLALTAVLSSRCHLVYNNDGEVKGKRGRMRLRF